MATKTLRVCLMKELPSMPERDVSYLYFAYDKLLLFFGQNQYYDPFVVCETMPDNPIDGVVYIDFTGTVYTFIDDSVVTIAEIEDSTQAEGLKSLGTTYFLHSDRRYLDLQRRTIHLPYLNGTYSLSVGVAKELMINDNTVIRYDKASERFYIDGEYDGPPRLVGYYGENTRTVETEVYDKCIHANLKLSSEADNLLQIVKGGLYATVSNKATIAELQNLVDRFQQYQEHIDEIMEALDGRIDTIVESVTSESIQTMIMNALTDYYDDIDNLIKTYEDLSDLLAQIEADSKAYTDETFDNKTNELEDYIDNAVEQWTTF